MKLGGIIFIHILNHTCACELRHPIGVQEMPDQNVKILWVSLTRFVKTSSKEDKTQCYCTNHKNYKSGCFNQLHGFVNQLIVRVLL